MSHAQPKSDHRGNRDYYLLQQWLRRMLYIYIYIFGIGERLLPVELNPVKMNSIKLTNNNTRWNEVRS